MVLEYKEAAWKAVEAGFVLVKCPGFEPRRKDNIFVFGMSEAQVRTRDRSNCARGSAK